MRLFAFLVFAACGPAGRESTTPAVQPPSPLERAMAFERGAGVARDYAASTKIYAEALCRDGNGDANACYHYFRAAAGNRGFDDDQSHARFIALSVALCERQHHALACFVVGMTLGTNASPAAIAEIRKPKHSCDAGDVDACELKLGEMDVWGSSGREEKRRDAAETACTKDSIDGCAYLVHPFDDCKYEAGQEHCRDKLLAKWTKDGESDRLTAFAKLDALCKLGEADACLAIPGRELARKALCAAHDYNACAELGCLGDKADALTGSSHGASANCHAIANREAARNEPEVPDPVADPPPAAFTPADKPPFESLAFRKLAEFDYYGWPKFEIYNLGKRKITTVDVVAYSYDAQNQQVSRAWGMRVKQPIDPGAHVAAEVTDQMHGSYLGEGPATVEVCYEAIAFEGDPKVYRARCPSVRPRGAASTEVTAIDLHPLLPWEGQFNEAWTSRAFDDVWIAAFEKQHPELMIDLDDGWNRGPLRVGPESKADIARALTKTSLKPDQHAIPIALTGVAVVYHLDGVGQLQLSAPTLAKIFDGTIKKWNDPAILKDNPGATMPDLAISASRASEGRPLSVAFAQFIAKAAPHAWKLGKGKVWPDGVPFSDFEPGRAASVQTANGAITYVELPAAIGANLERARIRNRAGVYIAPTAASTSAAASRVAVDADLFFDPIDPPGANAYPISFASWAVIDRKPADPVRAHIVHSYLELVLGSGQALLEAGNYGALPPALAKRALAAL